MRSSKAAVKPRGGNLEGDGGGQLHDGKLNKQTLTQKLV